VYVCVCHAVSEAEVEASVHAGATTVRAVGQYTRAGTSCGTCHDHIDEVIAACAANCALARLLAHAG
jgi:bacterioferritin-associated ferredoxin